MYIYIYDFPNTVYHTSTECTHQGADFPEFVTVHIETHEDRDIEGET